MSAVATDDRTQWLGWRRQGVGASDVAAILGISPWASPWSVWADKLGLLPPEPENEAMSAGRWLEAAIGPWFEHETGLVVAGEQTQCTHAEHLLHRCTVDGFVGESHRQVDLLDALGVLEIKVTGPGRRWDEVPEHYQCQGQWQMHVTGHQRVWFAVLMGRRLDIHELERDRADIDFMVERVDAFWRDHVETGKPPDTDGHDATLRALAAVYPEHTPGESAPLDELAATLATWAEAKAFEATAKKAKKAAEAEIKAALGDAEEGTVEGQRVVTCRTQTKTDTCRACGDKRTSDPFRVLRPAKPKGTTR